MRPDPALPAALAFGPFLLDLDAARLLRDGEPVDLAPRPWSVLVHLASRAGELVSKDELLDAVWGHRHVTDAALKVAINGLRQRLGDDAAAPSCIATVPRRGYRFVAPVTRVARPARTPEPTPARTAAPAVARRGNLPEPTARLIGREYALAELQGLMQRHRLVTLQGPGGVGKTRLALAVGAVDTPADGAWLVRLDGLADAGALLDTLARTFSLGANASRDVTALVQALAPMAARIVLDNAEHLIDDLAPLVTRLLQEAPGLRLLVTSQSALRVAAEVVMPVPALAVPPEDAGDGATGFSAVALFVERVATQMPGWRPDAAALADIVALCRLLDGLPLAIELAAARVPLLGTAGVRERMHDRFALLSRGARDAPQRHRTLRQALEWSFGLLDEPTRRVQRRLSVFPGSFSLEAANGVAGDGEIGAAVDASAKGGWDVLDALQSLHDQSLLVIEPAVAGGARRYRQLESVRALAAEELREAGEEGRTQWCLARVMCELFRQAQARYTRTPLLPWLSPLRPEADNLRQAMTHLASRLAAGHEAPAERAAVRLALALFSHAMQFWLRSGRKREALAWFNALSPHAGSIDTPAQRAHYALALGALAAYAQSMPPAEAMPWLDEAERLFIAEGDARSAMLALYLHAALRQRTDPHSDRQPLLVRMRALEQPDWTPRERNFAAWTAATIAHGRGDLQAFRSFCAEDLARAKAADDHAEAWLAAFGLGQALWILQERAQAARVLGEAVDDLRAHGLLREYATTAALAASMRLALAFEPGPEPTPRHREPEDELLAAMREAADVIRGEGMLWWMGDALMLLPLRRGDRAAALTLCGWMDGRMAALGMQRSPVAQTLRGIFDTALAEARRRDDGVEPPVAPGLPPDDSTVMRLAFG
jgi:predicted ATPase/DNA-binding winged helix-turn-helix (wHTH) protein